jgi:molybdopterin biosynthesis enzyme
LNDLYRASDLRVKPFLPLVVAVISKQRPDPKQRDRFKSILQRKLAWFGASLLAPRYVATDVAAARNAFTDMIQAGADLILTAGSSASDPLDSFVVSVEELGGTLEERGTPTHPGSFFWLAYLADRPVFGMPFCGAYSESTVVDLLLLRVMAGLKPRRPDIAVVGAGGLFGRATEALFPTYDIANDDLASIEAIGSGPG